MNTAVQLAAIAGSLGAPIWGYVGEHIVVEGHLMGASFYSVFCIDHAALHGLWYVTGATTVAAALSYIISKDTYKIIAQRRQLHKR